MKLTFKIMTVAILAVAMLLTMMTGVFAAEEASAAAVDSITVDGVKEDAWDAATEYTLTNEVSDDSRGDAATKKDSSEVKFRVAYTAEKVYMLFTIEDDTFIKDKADTHWRNDSIFLYVSENGTDTGLASENSYQMAIFLSEEGTTKSNGFFVRNSGVNTKEKEHKVVIDGTTAIVEISFKLNTVTPAAGGNFKLDVQYNDQDLDPATAEEQSRTIVWSWSADAASGPNNNRGQWGTINFAAPAVDDDDDTTGDDTTGDDTTGDDTTGDDTTGDDTTGDDTTGDDTTTDNPTTGDMTLVLAALAIIALAGTALIRRRVRN